MRKWSPHSQSPFDLLNSVRFIASAICLLVTENLSTSDNFAQIRAAHEQRIFYHKRNNSPYECHCMHLQFSIIPVRRDTRIACDVLIPLKGNTLIWIRRAAPERSNFSLDYTEWGQDLTILHVQHVHERPFYSNFLSISTATRQAKHTLMDVRYGVFQ